MLFGGVVKAILGDRDTYAGRKSIHHRTKNGVRKFRTPFSLLIVMKEFYQFTSVSVCVMSVQGSTLMLKLIQAFNSLVSGSLEPSPVIVAYIL